MFSTWNLNYGSGLPFKLSTRTHPTIRGLLISIIGLAVGCISATIHATTVTGKVTSLFARSSDQLQAVDVGAGIAPGRPPCAANQSYYIILDENSRAGQAQYATLLSAQLAGKSVEIVGAGTCRRWSDGEDILFVRIVN